MAKSVLRELDQLRSMLDKPSASSSLRESYSSEYSSRPEGMKTYSYALNTAEVNYILLLETCGVHSGSSIITTAPLADLRAYAWSSSRSIV